MILITTKDPRNIRGLYIENAQALLDIAFYIAVCSVFLCQMHYALLFLPLAGGIAGAIVIICYKKRIRKLFNDVWQDSSKLATTVQESIYGVRTVAAFAQEEGRRKYFAADNEKYRDTNIGGAHIFAKRSLFMTLVRGVTTVAAVGLGIWLGLSGRITAGEFTAMVGYMGSLIWQITSLLH